MENNIVTGRKRYSRPPTQSTVLTLEETKQVAGGLVLRNKVDADGIDGIPNGGGAGIPHLGSGLSSPGGAGIPPVGGGGAGSGEGLLHASRLYF